MSQPPLQLSLVDDHDAIRDALLHMLSGLGCPMQAYASGAAFLETADLQAPGCVVLDLRMEHDTAGIAVFDALLAQRSPKVVLFLSSFGDIQKALAQVKKGAFDWLEKPVDGTILKTRVKEALALAAVRWQALQIWNSLTGREREVAHGVARGLSSKEIARWLVPEVDSRTVDTFRTALRDKSGILNQADMRAWMVEHVWLTQFEPHTATAESD
jgi:two-component system response regulator TtrR